MRIGILDVGGNFFGPAWGLKRLGHEIRYCPLGLADYLEELGRALFAYRDEPDFDVDLFVYAASFVDETWTAAAEIQPNAPVDPQQPMLPSIHPEQAKIRRRWLEERIARHPAVALVDLSDNDYFQDPWFEANGHWRFRRELATWRESEGVRAFPYLYQPALIWNEIVHGLESVHLPQGMRGVLDELVFAGCVDHWRYRGSRARALSAIGDQHPALKLRLEQRLPLGRVWELLQQARGGLYLHGGGQICFRLHELAALGVPALAPESFTVALPQGAESVLSNDPASLPAATDMLRFYVQSYHPVHAAEALLSHIGALTCA